MRRTFLTILAFVMVFGLCACGSNSSATVGPNDQELGRAVDLIKEAYDAMVSNSTELLDWWPYIDLHYSMDASAPAYNDTNFVNYRNNTAEANNNLATAKSLLGTKGTGEYYTAVKKFYTQVQSFYDFLFVFPEGYSKLTFSNEVSSHKQNCIQAYNDAAFYK